MWIATVQRLDWPTPGSIEAMKAEYLSMLDYAVATRINAVIVQVRPTADAFWPWPLEPWSQYLTGTAGLDPGWDPLAFLVEEAHKRNLEFHAWFNPYRVSMPAPRRRRRRHHQARRRPPGAQAPGVDGSPTRSTRRRPALLQPGHPRGPRVRAGRDDGRGHAVRHRRRALRRLLLPVPGRPARTSATTPPSRSTARASPTKADWRRNNIDLLIQELGQRIKAAKPWVKFGVSPFGIWRNQAADPLGSETTGIQSYDAIFADTRKWVKEDWIDYIVPQIYWHIGLRRRRLRQARAVVGRRGRRHRRAALHRRRPTTRSALAGQPADWFDPTELTNHLTFNRDYPEVDGDVHFRAKHRAGQTGIGSSTDSSRPTTTPGRRWCRGCRTCPRSPLLFPIITHDSRDAAGVTLTIRPVWGEVTSYAIYRFKIGEQPCVTDDARNLVGTVRRTGRETTFVDTTAVEGERYVYLATALDRVWNEGPPSPPRFA